MSPLSTTTISSINHTPVHGTITYSQDLFGFSPFFLFISLLVMVFFFCMATWVLLVCHYRLKYQIATLKQFNTIDASALRQVTRQQSNPSSYYNDCDTHQKQDSSLDISHSYDYHKERTKDMIADKLSSDSANLTINRLYNLNHFSKPTQSPRKQANFQRNTNQIIHGTNHRSRHTNDESLISYIGLSHQSSRRTLPMYSKRDFTDTNQAIFPFLSKQESNSPTDKLLMDQIEHAKAQTMQSIKIEHIGPKQMNRAPMENIANTQATSNHLSIPVASPSSSWLARRKKSKSKSGTPISSHSETSSSTYTDTRSGHTLYHVAHYNNCKHKTTSRNLIDKSLNNSSSYSISYATTSPSSLLGKHLEKERDDADDELSNDYEVQLKIVDVDDKENCNTRNSFSLHKITGRLLNKNRMTQTEDEFYIEPSGTRLSSQMIETSRSNETIVVHGDSSCLTNVLDESNEQSDENDDVSEDNHDIDRGNCHKEISVE